jgi:acetyl/propionyl-CoA carboxylase alpha subunit
MRLYAEDPVDFLPRSGRLLEYREPQGPGIRVDSGVESGSVVGLEYDPLLAKLIVWAPDREAAIGRARRALAEWVVLGVETNLPLLAAVLDSEAFASGRYSTDLVARLPRRAQAPAPDAAWIAAALAAAPVARSPRAPSSAPDPWSAWPGWRLGG